MKICLVCANGGHLIEMLQLMDAFEEHETFFITFSGDDTKDLERAYFFIDYKSRLIKFITLLLGGFKILLKERPNVLISTGGAIAIPIFYIGKLFGMKLVFIESFTRVTTKSGGGRVVYPIVDLFLVQWEELLKKYGKKAQYKGQVL